MIEPLLKAIYSKWTADANLTAAFTAGLHYGLAPANTDLPRCVYSILPGPTPQGFFGGGMIETHIIQFEIEGEGSEEVAGLADLLDSKFHNVKLTVESGGGTNLSSKRMGNPVIEGPFREGHREYIFFARSIYEFKLEP